MRTATALTLAAVLTSLIVIGVVLMTRGSGSGSGSGLNSYQQAIMKWLKAGKLHVKIDPVDPSQANPYNADSVLDGDHLLPPGAWDGTTGIESLRVDVTSKLSPQTLEILRLIPGNGKIPLQGKGLDIKDVPLSGHPGTFNMTITSQEFNLEKQSIQSYSAAGILNTGPDAITKKIFLTVNTKNEPNVDAA